MTVDTMLFWLIASALLMFLGPGMISLAITLIHDRDPARKLTPLYVEPIDQAEVYNFEEYQREYAREASGEGRRAA